MLSLVAYFLRLGALGFGGPVALANYIRRDLVERRAWLTEQQYEDGLALSAACPGPLAYQLGVYCGYVRNGIAGALAVAVAFGLPPFVLVVAAAAVYQRYSAAWQLRALFYGIAPAVLALIVKACWALGKKTIGRDARAWTFFAVACAVTVILQRELAPLFVLAGLLGVFVFGERKPRMAPALSVAVTAPVLQLFAFFFKTGLLVFGSGLVIVPFLKMQVVDQYHWLNDLQFLDAVAIGMISPGPVVITATFVGYLLRGFAGAAAATAGIFAPPVLFVVCATPLLLRYRSKLRGFVRGVSTAVVGVLAGTTWLIGKTAVVDIPTAIIAVTALLAITLLPKKVPDPLVIAAAGIAGLLLRV